MKAKNIVKRITRPKINTLEEVGALRIIQLWAHIILHKGKNVENRQKNSHYRRTIASHASSINSKGWFDDARTSVQREDVPFGAIVDFAELTEVLTEHDVTVKTRKWFDGKYGYVMKKVISLKKPIPMKGVRGLWKLKGKKLEDCFEQLNASQLKSLKPFIKPKWPFSYLRM